MRSAGKGEKTLESGAIRKKKLPARAVLPACASRPARRCAEESPDQNIS